VAREVWRWASVTRSIRQRMPFASMKRFALYLLYNSCRPGEQPAQTTANQGIGPPSHAHSTHHVEELQQTIALATILTLRPGQQAAFKVSTHMLAETNREEAEASMHTRTHTRALTLESMVTKYSVSLKLPMASLHWPYTTASACQSARVSGKGGKD
jgi:hypothetical protein